MNKIKFLNKLEKKLEILNEEELKDIINEYEMIIDEKVKHGKTEEEAINEFGDIDILSKEILEAYKLNADKVDEDDFFNSLDSTIKKGARKLSEYTKDVVDEAESKEVTVDMVFEIIIKAIVILLLLMIPFSMLRGILTAFTNMVLPSNLFGQFVISIISGFMSLLFLALVILVIYLIIRDTTTNGSVEKSIRKKVKSELSEEIAKEEKVVREEIRKELDKEEELPKENNFTTVFMAVLKVILIIHAIPLVFSLFTLYILLGFGIYLFFKGVSVIGLILLTISAIIVTSFILKLIFKLVKTNFKPGRMSLSSLATAFIIFIIGFFFTVEFIGNVEFVNRSPKEKLFTATHSQTYVVDEDVSKLLLRDIDNYEVIIDNSVDLNTALVSVDYIEDFLEIGRVSITENNIYVETHEKFRLISMFNLFVEDLKDDKVYNNTKLFDYEISVFVSQETLDLITTEEL